MAWQKLEIKIPDLDLTPLQEIIDKIKEFIQVIVTILETILTIIAAIADPLVEAIKKLLEKIKSLVEGFLEDLGAYALYVPIRKRLMTKFLGLGDVTPSWAGQLGIFGEPSSPMNPATPELNQFLVDANRYNGGNYGFFATVLESLYDEGDIARPQFMEETDYVGGYVLLMGTDFDPLGFLDDIWVFFGLFNFPDTIPKAPRPKGLKAHAMTEIVDKKFTVLLTWDLPEVPVNTLMDLGSIILWPSRYAVIRVKNDVRALGAASVIDLMGTRTISAGDKFNNGDAEVLVEDEYDLTRMSYFDEDVPCSKGDSYYYAVAWKLKAFGADATDLSAEKGTDLDYWYISNVARVTPFPILPASTPPDWVRTPSISSLFPEFAALLRRIVLELENIANKFFGAVDMLKQYVEFLKSEIQRYEALVNKILDELKKLLAKFKMPKAGIYMRKFKGQGGNSFFLSDLASSLMQGYENAPPFHRGDEFVTGAIFLAGAPEEGVVDAFIELLGVFFGGSEDESLSSAIGDLMVAVDNAEDTYFGPNMETAVEEPVAFRPNMQLDPVCSTPVESTSTFSPNMQVINAAV